jgi:GIY-YIG catalytic domain
MKSQRGHRVYKATFENGRSYIGLTSNTLEQRRKEHESVARRKPRTIFHRMLRHYPAKWEILQDNLTLEEANSYEISFIQKFDTIFPKGFNQVTGGGSWRVSEDTKMRMSKAHGGRKHSRKTREKIALGNTGKIRKGESNLAQARSMGGKTFLVFEKFSGRLIGEWDVVRKCARDLGVDASNLSSCLKGRTKYLKNFTFKYKIEP